MTGADAGQLGLTLTVTLAAAIAFLLIFFWIGRRIGRYNVVDVAWGPAFGLIAVVALAMSGGHGTADRKALLTAATLVWGLRLGGFIAWRSRGRGEDPRYEQMLDQAPRSRTAYALRKVFLLQAGLIWLISVPVQAGMFQRAGGGWTWLLVAGGVLWAGGVVFESVGDWQLARFKSDPAHRGRVMDRGLWRYTRHPNYFGDACVWWGLFLISLGSWAGLAAVFAPVLMTFLLAAGSGKPITEERMGTRPGYAEYVARTSGFVPLPPRAGAGAGAGRGPDSGAAG
jgi:steroid 5-alpha reductase family enzyme